MSKQIQAFLIFYDTNILLWIPQIKNFPSINSLCKIKYILKKAQKPLSPFLSSLFDLFYLPGKNVWEPVLIYKHDLAKLKVWGCFVKNSSR